MTDMGIGLQEVGLALASRVISHDTLLSVRSYRMEDQVVAVGRTEYRHIALKLRPHSRSAFRVKLGTSSTSHDPLSLHAAISDVNLVEMPCAVSGLTLSLYLHPIGHQSDAPRLARANSPIVQQHDFGTWKNWELVVITNTYHIRSTTTSRLYPPLFL
jgi:hypothetical protein